MRLIKTVTMAAVFAALLSSAAGELKPDVLATYYGFGEIEIIKLDWGIKALRTADFNGEGRVDMAVVNNRKARIELLIQKEQIGPGETAVTVDPNDIDINAITPPTRFEKQSVAVSQKIHSFVCGDLNSDKMMDLAFYGEPKGLYVILQKGAESKPKKKKTLSWQTRKKIKIKDGLVRARALVCADLNNDGADDLVLAGRDVVYIVLQKKDGSLAEPVKYPTTGGVVRAIEVGDLNGDNINDLTIITNDDEKPIHVRFGLKTGELGPEMRFFIEAPRALELYNIDQTNGDEILIVDRSQRLGCYKLVDTKQKDADWPVYFYPLGSNRFGNL